LVVVARIAHRREVYRAAARPSDATV
jgi:hypothetical protein